MAFRVFHPFSHWWPRTLSLHMPVISQPAGNSEHAGRYPEALQGVHRPVGREGGICLMEASGGLECYRLNCVPSTSYVEVLTPRVSEYDSIWRLAL